MLGLSSSSATLVTAVCLLCGSAMGCGSDGRTTGDSTQAQSPAKELATWYQGVEASVAKMEQKQRGFTQFRVDQPPARAGLVKLSPAGIRAGEIAESSATGLSDATSLTQEEAKGLYCYFFVFYVDLEFFPDRDEFEEVIFNLVKPRLLPATVPIQVHRSADALRRSMIRAENGGLRSSKVAAGILC
jgi:hypothetical protein